MITWIQRYFQKHFKTVFLLILLAMGIPLIVIFSPSSGAGPAASKLKEQAFFNVNLGNEGEARRVMTDGNLSAQLKTGYNALEGAQLQQYALQRVAGLAVADQLHLPQPTSDEVAKYVLTLRAFQDKAGQFDQAAYTAFGDSLKSGTSVTTADVNRVLRDDTRLEQFDHLVGGPGYVLPQDVEQQLIRTDSKWTVQLATLDYASFNPSIATPDDVLKKFYDENSFRYDVPVRPRLSYVEFKNSDFMPPTAPTEADLRGFYNANAARFPVPPDPSKKDAAPSLATPAAPVDNFPKVRAQVEAALKDAASAQLAAKAANDFTVALFNQNIKPNSTELTEFLAAQHRPAVALPLFVPDAPPAGMPWLAADAEQISRLSAERFFSDPVPTGTATVVLLWSESVPGYKPAFAEVRDRVLADFKDSEKRKLFIARGRALHTQLQAAAKTGAAAFAAAAAAEKLDVKSFAAFTLKDAPKELPYSAQNALASLTPGDVSDMMATEDKGFLVYVQDKKLPDLTPENLRFVEVKKQLMLFTAGSNTNAYLRSLVDSELKKSPPPTP